MTTTLKKEEQPYFSVGEEVILVSKQFPEHNGEYTIRQVLSGLLDTFSCRISGDPKRLIRPTGGGFAYVFEEILSVEDRQKQDLREGVWDQSALRKKHKPAEGNESFKEMISNLNKIKMEM